MNFLYSSLLFVLFSQFAAAQQIADCAVVCVANGCASRWTPLKTCLSLVMEKRFHSVCTNDEEMVGLRICVMEQCLRDPAARETTLDYIDDLCLAQGTHADKAQIVLHNFLKRQTASSLLSTALTVASSVATATVGAASGASTTADPAGILSLVSSAISALGSAAADATVTGVAPIQATGAVSSTTLLLPGTASTRPASTTSPSRTQPAGLTTLTAGASTRGSASTSTTSNTGSKITSPAGSATLPPTPSAKSDSGLSTGAKVGLGVGIPLGLIMMGGFAYLGYWFGKRGRAQRAKDNLNTTADESGGVGGLNKTESEKQKASGGLHEIDGNNLRGHELPTGANTAELPTQTGPVELSATNSVIHKR